MPIKEKISATQFWGFLFRNTKTIVAIPTFMGLLLLGVWKLYGYDKVKDTINCELAPVRQQIASNTKQINIMAFDIKQAILIIKKEADPKTVKEVELMTEPFRPLKNGELIKE